MKYKNGIDAAIAYLKKKEEEKDARKPLALIPWVIGMLAMWTIVFALYYGY